MAKTSRIPDEKTARRERQRELTRQRARRRRANPDVRARDAEAKRRRRESDPELRAREAEAVRKRRKSDPELRAREAEARSRLREANPEQRKRYAAAQRRRRNEVAGLRVIEAFQRRQRREISTSGADGRFKKEFLNREFGHSCKIGAILHDVCRAHQAATVPISKVTGHEAMHKSIGTQSLGPVTAGMAVQTKKPKRHSRGIQTNLHARAMKSTGVQVDLKTAE